MDTDNQKSSNHEGNREAKVRKDRVKKRSFRGNQYSSDQSTEKTSSSAKKLKNSGDLEATYNSTIEYVILSFTQFS